MNKIKSLFIGIFPMYAMGLSGYGIYQLITSGVNYIWLGAVLTSLPILLFFNRVMMFKNVPRTSNHFPVLTVVAVLGIGLAIYGFVESGLTNRLGMLLTTIGFVTFFLYNYWYSSLGREQHIKLQVGKQLPSFKVNDVDGNAISSSSFHGSPLILMFFRGNWCPLCMAQIKEIVAKYQELSALGAKVALVAPQPEKNTQALAAKFNVSFMFLTDVGNQAAKTLGIEMKNGLPSGMELLGYNKDTVYPTIIITNAKGKIIYNDFTNNYRIRPEPEEFIKVLKMNSQLV